MSLEPWLWLIAGPNGAGKSTLAEGEFSDLPNINPDVEARRFNPRQPGLAALSGGRSAIAAAENALIHGESFTLETTLSGRWHFRLVARARGAGWRIGLAYVGITDPERALLRVRERYRRGGHNVPQGDVERRYHRSLSNLPAVLLRSDVATIYDNSLESGYRQVLHTREREIIYLASDLPGWLKRSLRGIRLVVGSRIGDPRH